MSNGTFDVVAWNNEYARRYIPSTVLQSLYLVLGVCGNLTAIIIYTTKMNSKHDDRYFIPFLASVDLAGCIVSTTFMLLSNNLPYMYPNTAICQLLHFSASALIIGSIFLLFVISVQRYQKICRPFGFQMNLRCKRIVASSVLLLAGILAIPTIFLYEKIEVVHSSTNVTGHRCGPKPNTTTFGEIYRGIIMVSEFISMVCMCISYGFVGYTLMTKLRPKRKYIPQKEISMPSTISNTRITAEDSAVSETACDSTECQLDERAESTLKKANKKRKQDKTNRTGKKYSLMFMFISLISALCFFPPWIFILLETKDKTFWIRLSYAETQVFVIFRGMFVLNFVVNPFIYCFFDTKFRGYAFKYCPCKTMNS